MTSSGIQVSKDATAMMAQVMKGEHAGSLFVISKDDAGKDEVRIAKSWPKGTDRMIEEIRKAMKEFHAAYILWIASVQMSHIEQPKKVPILLKWINEDKITPKQKMPMAATFATVVTAVGTGIRNIGIQDYEDMDANVILDKVFKPTDSADRSNATAMDGVPLIPLSGKGNKEKFRLDCE